MNNENCPKCNAKRTPGDLECKKCGVIYAKTEKAAAKVETNKQTNISKKRRPSLIILVGGGFILFCLFVCVFGELVGMEKSPPLTHETRNERIEKLFSSWDGSNRDLTRTIKDSMNDPSSYDHDKTVYWDNGDHLIVKTTFRGKNAFGGVVKNTVAAKVDLNGKVIAIISQSK